MRAAEPVGTMQTRSTSKSSHERSVARALHHGSPAIIFAASPRVYGLLHLPGVTRWMRILNLAWPVMLAQVATATTGVVDTVLMARLGDRFDLAAVGIAAVVFAFLYWAFGFLRMSTTGLTAQAVGAGDHAESRAQLIRALVIGVSMGTALLAVFPLARQIALLGFDASPRVEELTDGYFDWRIIGAPAALMGYAICGWLLGVERTRALLVYQVVLSGTNIGLDILFAGLWRWGPAGIGLGTALAEWVALGVGLILVRDGLQDPAPLWDASQIRNLFDANRDILLRTLALLSSFAWFVSSSTTLGTSVVAGNEVLLQFVSVSAFVLDAFAFVAEREVGSAIGARDPRALRRALADTTELAVISAVGFSLVFWLGGSALLNLFVADAEAREVAHTYLPWCASIPFVGVFAWQLDGAFLGATLGRALRVAAIIATSAYIASDWLLSARFGNAGVWTAFVLMYVYRALALGAFLPRLLALAEPQGAPDPPSG